MEVVVTTSIRISNKKTKIYLDSILVLCYTDCGRKVNTMKPAAIIRAAMQRRGLNNAKLADLVDISQAAMWDRLKHDNMSVKVLEEMLRKMDYEIIVQPKALGRRPDGCFLLNMKEGESQ